MRYNFSCLNRPVFFKSLLFSLLFVSFHLHSAAQSPKSLRGKWEGEITIVINNQTIKGSALLGIGNFEAKTPNHIEVYWSKFENMPGKMFSYREATFSQDANGINSFSFQGMIPLNETIACNSKFHFVEMFDQDVPFLYGYFDTPADCKNATVKVVLFQRSYLKGLAKSGKSKPDVSRLLPGRAQSAIVSTSSPIATAERNIGTQSPGASGKVLKLASNPVVLNVDKIDSFNDGYAVVSKGNAQALIDANGKIVIPFNKYTYGNIGIPARPIANTFYRGMNIPYYGFLNGVCIVQDPVTKKAGMINTKLELVIPCKYRSLENCNNEGFIETSYGTAKLTFNRDGKIVPNTVDEKIPTQKAKLVEDKILGNNPYKGVFTSSGLYLCYLYNPNGLKLGYTDRIGNFKIKAEFEDAGAFHDGMAAVSKKDEFGVEKWGFVNVKGEMAIPFTFTNKPNDFHDGLALVTPVNKNEFEYAYIDKTGKPVIKIKSDDREYYLPYTLGRLEYTDYAYASRIKSNFENGHALWFKSMREGNSGTSGVMVLNTNGEMYSFGDALKRNGWPSTYFTALGDFVNNEILIASKNGMGREEIVAIANVKGEILLRTPLENGQYGSISHLFDPVSNLTRGTLTINGKTYIGYINRDGIMKIIVGDVDKW